MTMMVNGKEERVGSSIKACKTVLVEIGCDQDEQQLHDQEWARYGHVLSKPTGSSNDNFTSTR